MAKIAVERTIGKTKKAVLGGLIGYNTEKMGKQKYKRFAISLREGDKIVGGIVGEVWTTVLFIQLFWIEQKLRGKDYGTRLIKAIEDEAKKVRGDAVLSGHDEFSGAGLLPRLRLRGIRFDRRLSRRHHAALVHESAMSTSNSKFRTGSKEAPTEPFKRAVTSCLRAIAKAPELEVTLRGRAARVWRRARRGCRSRRAR